MDIQKLLTLLENVVKISLRKGKNTNNFTLNLNKFDEKIELFVNPDDGWTKIIMACDATRMRNDQSCRKRLTASYGLEETLQKIKADPFNFLFKKFGRHYFVVDGVDIRCRLTYKKGGLYAQRVQVGTFADGVCRNMEGDVADGWRFPDIQSLRLFLKEKGEKGLTDFLVACDPRKDAQKAHLVKKMKEKQIVFPYGQAGAYRWNDSDCASVGDIVKIPFLKRDGKTGFRHALIMGESQGLEKTSIKSFVCCLLRDDGKEFLEKDEVELGEGWIAELWNFYEFGQWKLHPERDISDTLRESAKKLVEKVGTHPVWNKMPFFPSTSPISGFRRYEREFFVKMSNLI